MWLSSQKNVALRINKHIHEIKKTTRKPEEQKENEKRNNELGKVEDDKLQGWT